MWWEVLPSATIIGTLVALPQFTAYYWNWAFFGSPYKRKLESVVDRHMFARDGLLTGAAWIVRGLESLPDD